MLIKLKALTKSKLMPHILLNRNYHDIHFLFNSIAPPDYYPWELREGNAKEWIAHSYLNAIDGTELMGELILFFV